jgi:acyl-CoA synthetase (AMP-forming)/AMP-acid ligase II
MSAAATAFLAQKGIVMIATRYASAVKRPAAASGKLSDPRRILARWEAATALMLASPPTADASIGLARMLPVWIRWREHPVGALIAAAARHPRRTAIIDDEGSLSFAQVDARSNALARTWRSSGVGPGTTIGLLARDGRLFMDVAIATQKLGANLVYLNAAFSAPQIGSVVAAEGIDLLVHDESLAASVVEARPERIVGEQELRHAVAAEDNGPLKPPDRPGRIVVLTSGTTGRPKGAVRQGTTAPMDSAALLASLPVMSGDTTVVAAPLFHGFGLFGANLALALNSAVVLRPRFDPERVVADIAESQAAALVAVPVMLQRLVALPKRRTDCYDTSCLRVVLCGGAALSGTLANEFMDRFGEVLYNVYGSTESGFATVASPRDLRKAPGTAGRPTPGVVVRIADEDGKPVRAGVTGRVLVGSNLRMDGYTGGGGKEIIDGLVVTGDLGHVDRQGRLFIDGREDDMIVSGGENVFPGEVEETLMTHSGVAEAAVVGVEDPEFGERLKAFVVKAEGSEVTEDELKAYVHDRLARFKTPREVVFQDELPRTATGKIIRHELRNR